MTPAALEPEKPVSTRTNVMAAPPARIGLSRGEHSVIATGVAGLVAVAGTAVLLFLWTSLESDRLIVLISVLALAGLSFAALLVLSLSLLQRLGVRVRQLREVAADLGLGDLSVRAPVEPHDDLGALGLALNAMADRIARVLQAQKDLLSGVSHELRSPLARIEVALELVRIDLEQTRAATPEAHERRSGPAEQLLEDIHEEVLLLERHIERLLAAQRVGVDRVLVQRTDLVLDELVRTILRRDEKRLQQLGFTVESKLGLPAGVISGDPNALDRVLSTLVENVVQHGHDPAGGEPTTKALRLETGRDELGAFVRVLDRGPGLSPEQCTRVFEAFYRTDASRARNTGGTGLGLYLVKRIIEAHGGTARAAPRPGGGLMIELRLPLPGVREQKETVKMQAISGPDATGG